MVVTRNSKTLQWLIKTYNFPIATHVGAGELQSSFLVSRLENGCFDHCWIDQMWISFDSTIDSGTVHIKTTRSFDLSHTGRWIACDLHDLPFITSRKFFLSTSSGIFSTLSMQLYFWCRYEWDDHFDSNHVKCACNFCLHPTGQLSCLFQNPWAVFHEAWLNNVHNICFNQIWITLCAGIFISFRCGYHFATTKF